MRKVKVALAQMKMSEGFEANVQRCNVLMKQAARKRANIICFPELQFERFFPQHPGREEAKSSAVRARGVLVEWIAKEAKRLRLVTVLNLYEKSGGKYYDSSPVIDANGKVLGVSRMVHIIQTEHFYEQDYYAPSSTGFRVYDTKHGKVGVVICFDRHFPESFRLAALQGAEIAFAPSANLKGEALDVFECEMRAAAYQNNLFVAMVNRVGEESDITFCGESLLVGPDGEVLGKGGDSEELLISTIDLDEVKKARKARPFLELRRPKEYRRLARTP
jgi:predicted amidohydrolase